MYELREWCLATVMMMSGFWVTHLCSLLVPPSLAMAGCTTSVWQWIAYSLLGLTESSSQRPCLALWSLYISWSWSLPEACSMPEEFFGWCIILCSRCHGFSLEAKSLQTWHKFHMESWEPLLIPLTTQGLLGDMAVGTAACTCKRALFCSWPYSELTAFHVTWWIGHSNIPKYRICCLQDTKWPTSICTFFVGGSRRCNIFPHSWMG